ncbi:MAG: orotidine-5'-phosphate decarboxylase [Firmicutes bacterium]|nr:orotidine-5'-phosphate decarboxylase [Bacillota bacterium]
MTDTLIEKIIQTKNPVCVGLDTAFEYLPDAMRKNCTTLSDAAQAITEFNLRLIERLKDVIPSVKVQAAYYEMYGVPGMQAFSDTLQAARKAGLIVIADAKRNDIGATASCYSAAFLGETDVNGLKLNAFSSDFLTVNAYLGADGIEPFLKHCRQNNKGIFVLVKTSNPSSGQLQNRKFENGETLFETVADLVEEWGADTVGKYGYSRVGAVVGATHPNEASILRKRLKHTLFLIPGYGAQGGSADGLSVCFDGRGLGGIVNNSRGILCAYKSDAYKGLNYIDAAYAAVEDMQKDITSALHRAGKSL